MVMSDYVDVMWPRIQVAQHLHYMPGIPCQQNICVDMYSHLYFSIYFCSYLVIFVFFNICPHFDRHALQCSQFDSPNLHRGLKTCQIMVQDNSGAFQSQFWEFQFRAEFNIFYHLLFTNDSHSWSQIIKKW